MSADGYAKCPKCQKQIEENFNKMVEKVKKSYGKVSEEKYLKDLETIKNEPIIEPTLREDWEIGTCEGTFSITYSAWCFKCGLKYNYTYSEDILKQ